MSVRACVCACVCMGLCVCVCVCVCVKRETSEKMKWVGITFHLLDMKALNQYGSSGSLLNISHFESHFQFLKFLFLNFSFFIWGTNAVKLFWVITNKMPRKVIISISLFFHGARH